MPPSSNKPGMSEQSIGFMLKVESDTTVADLKKAEKTFESIEKTVKKSAQGITDSTNQIMNQLNKLAEAGVDLKGINLADIPTDGGGNNRSSASGVHQPGVGHTATPSPLNDDAEDLKKIRRMGYGSWLTAILLLNKKVHRGDARAAKAKDIINKPDVDTQEKFDSLYKRIERLHVAVASQDPTKPMSSIHEGHLNKVMADLLKRGVDQGFTKPVPSAITMDKSVRKDPSAIHDELKDIKNAIYGTRSKAPSHSGDSGGRASGHEGMGSVMRELLPPELSKQVGGMMAIFSAAFTKGQTAAKSFYDLIGGPGLVAMLATVAAAKHAASEYNEFRNILMIVRQQTQATGKELSHLGDIMLDLSAKTGASMENVSKAIVSLRVKGVNAMGDDFERLTEDAVKLAKVFGVSAGEMGEFIGDLNKHLKLTAIDIEQIGASMILAQKETNVPMESLKDNIDSVTQSAREFQWDNDGAKRKAMQDMIALTGALSKTTGDTAEAAKVFDAATNLWSEEGKSLMRLIQMSGDVNANMGQVDKLMKSGDAGKVFEMAAKGAERLKDTAHGSREVLKNYAESIGMSASEVEHLVAAGKSFADIQKKIKSDNAQKVINDRYKEALSTWDGMVEAVENFFKTFFAYVGAPIMWLPLKIFRGMLTVLQMIPSPLLKILGYLTGIALIVKTLSVVTKLGKFLNVIGRSEKAVHYLSGAIKKFMKTAPELLKGFKASVGAAGGKILGLVKTTKTAATATSGSMIALAANMANVAKAAGGAGEGAEVAEAGLLTLGGPEVAAVIAALVISIGEIAAAWLAVTSVFNFMIKNNDKGATELKKTVGDMVDSIGVLGDVFKSLFTGDFAKADQLATQFSDAFGKAADELPDKIKQFFDGLPKAVGDFMTSVFGDASSVPVDTIAGKLGLAFIKGIKAAFKIIADPEVVASIAKGLLTAGLIFVVKFAEWLDKSFTAVMTAGVMAVGKLLYIGLSEGLKSLWPDWATSLVEAIANKWTALKSTAEDFATAIVDKFKELLLKIPGMSKVFSMVDKATQAGSEFAKVKSSVGSTIAGAASFVGDAVSAIMPDSPSVSTGAVASDGGLNSSSLSPEIVDLLKENNALQRKLVKQGNDDGTGGGNSTTNQTNIFGSRSSAPSAMERKGGNGI
jgi:TP901 family phage tail tape measure protein